MVYLAKSGTGAGNVWFKIWQKGYDASRGKWCTDDMIDARGELRGITIPADLSPGNYLLRAEIIALHDAHMPHGAQPYVHCAELTLTGSGSATPRGVAIPGLYNDDDLRFDLYRHYNSFAIPGPAVYVPGSRKPSSSSSTPTPTPTTTTNSRCPVSISQASVDSWSDDGRILTQYNVIMKNVGSSPFNLKFRLSAKPTKIWNVVANPDGTYSLPLWMKGKIRAGQAFSFGYTVRRRNPLSVDLVVPNC